MIAVLGNSLVSQLILLIYLFMKNMVEAMISINYFMYKQKDFIVQCKY